MNIRKINGDNPLLREQYLNIPLFEIKSIYRKIIASYHTYLEDYGVKKLWKEESPLDVDDTTFIASLDAKMLQMIFHLFQLQHINDSKYTDSMYFHLECHTLLTDNMDRCHNGTPFFLKF